MQVAQQTRQTFKDHFLQAYRRYHIREKATSVAHGYGVSANHAQETEFKGTTADAMQALVYTATEDK